jgi:hypothetical protein
MQQKPQANFCQVWGILVLFGGIFVYFEMGEILFILRGFCYF